MLDCGGHLTGRLVIEGDAGAAEGRYVGTRRDGSPVDVRWADIYTIEDGKIKTQRSNFILPPV